jgi:iron complex transport system substrate-binding protein
MARYVTRVQEVRARLGRNGTAEVSITRWNPQGPAYMLNDSFAARVLADIGLKRPAAQQQPGVGHSPPLSLEQIGLIDADWLFLGTLSPEGDAVAALETAKAHPLFQQLRAVRAGHVVPVDGSQWTSLGGPLAALAILDQVAQAMAAN